MKFIMTVILLYACLSINAQQSTTEMKKIIDGMQDMYHVNFVYDSSLANIKPKSAPLSGSSLVENLKRVFSGIGIQWEIRDEYVLLFRQDSYTFSGYVCQENGETLINVTIFDMNTKFT